MMKFFTFLLACLCTSLHVSAQTGVNDPNFQPGTGANGLVYASVVQPDNKIIIAGSFTSYNGVVCNRIARINTDGSLDMTFSNGPGNGPDADVYSLALLPNGKIMIGGDFNFVSSTEHRKVARLSANGVIESSYNAQFYSTVHKIALQPDGKLVVGGDFTWHRPYVGGTLTTTLSCITRLLSDGNLDPTFQTNIGSGANGSVRSLAIQTDGKILIGGNFTSLNGSAISRINRLNSDGTLDPTFTSTGANNWVVDIQLQTDGKILLAGDFTNVNGSMANRFVRLTPTGTIDGIFNNCNTTVRTITVSPNGKIFLGGNFNLNPSYNAIRVVRLNSDLSYDASFGVPAANASVFTSNLLSDGRIFIGGDFTVYSGQSRTRVALIQNCEGFSLSAASASPTVCNGTAIPTITHNVTGFQSTTGIGTPTGLPAGVTATYSGGVISISGTPTLNGPFNYSIPMTGACQVTSATGTITVNGNLNISGLMGSSGPMSDPTVCINTSLPVMGFNCTNSTGIGTPTGLPAGVSAAWVSGQISITGAPTQSGVFTYNIPAVGVCGSATAIGTITVNDTPSAATPSSNGPFCPNVSISPITIATSGSVTSIGALNGAPSGLSASYSNGVITISGTPAFNPGTWNYSIQLIGSCGNAFATGSIEITEPTSAVAPLFQASYVCQGSPMITRKHPTYSNANLVDIAAATGLPPGCTATWSNDTIYISGTPTTAGSFNYMIPVYSDCNSEMALGTINVSDLPAEFFGPNATPTVCQNTPLDPITHPLTNITTIVSTTGLPAGVTAVLNPNVLSISGTPTVSGVFNYTIIGSSSCGTDTTYGTITVNPATVTVGAASATPFVCVDEMMATISHTCSGANAIGTTTGLPTGLITNLTGNTLSIAGTPSEVGTFNYNITLTGTCGSANATGTIGVLSSTNCTQGVEEANLINFAFAPNPTNGKVTFTFDGVSAATIEMIDLNGKLISRTTEVHSGDALSVEAVENGVYLIRILTEKGNYTQRLVKQ